MVKQVAVAYRQLQVMGERDTTNNLVGTSKWRESCSQILGKKVRFYICYYICVCVFMLKFILCLEVRLFKESTPYLCCVEESSD